MSNPASGEWLFLESRKGEAALNMAMDQTLLNATAALGAPVVRFYGWTQRAASFGYFQRYADVELLTPLRPLVRRPTGGGIVPHDRDWTYSMVFPAGHEWYELKAVESYRRVHEWIQAAFMRLGLETSVAPEPLHSLPGQCFEGHEQYDLLYEGRKIAGAAQRRTRTGLLIQGSVQSPKPCLSRDQWRLAMRQGVAATWKTLEWTPQLQAQAAELAQRKFGTEAFLKKR